MKPTLDLFQGISDPEASAGFYVIGGVCPDSCGAEQAHGYRELAQQRHGQIGDICQPQLGGVLQRMVDDAADMGDSLISLEYVPIAASLAATRDGVELSRSRQSGFDFRREQNSLVFLGGLPKQGGELVISYKRWGPPPTDCGGW